MVLKPRLNNQHSTTSNKAEILVKAGHILWRKCPLILWTELPSGSTDYTSDPQTVLLDSWTSPPSESTDSHISPNSKCSSNIVIVLLLCSVQVTSKCTSVRRRERDPSSAVLSEFSYFSLIRPIDSGFLRFSSPAERV